MRVAHPRGSRGTVRSAHQFAKQESSRVTQGGGGPGALLNLTWKVRLEDETQEGKGGVEKGGIGSIRGAVLYRGLRFLVTICCAIV